MAVEALHQTTATLREHLRPTVRPIDLARAAGVSRQYVHDVLQGHRPPSEKLLMAAVELGIPVKPRSRRNEASVRD